VGVRRLRGFHFPECADDCSTLSALHRARFSPAMIERFFRPFLGGVFLENTLETSVRKMEFVMNFFSRGDTAVPAKGMGEIPSQLAAGLPGDRILLGAWVVGIEDGGVTLEGGDRLPARAVVVATEAGAAARLFDGGDAAAVANHGVACLYFTAPVAPVDEPILMLNGEGRGVINNLTVMSAVSKDYAPPGRHLISVSVVDAEAVAAEGLEARVREDLLEWFGEPAREWELLRVDRIRHGVPAQPVVRHKTARVRPGIYQCGDHCGVASLNTAMASGTAAADAVIADFFQS